MILALLLATGSSTPIDPGGFILMEGTGAPMLMEGSSEEILMEI